MLLVGQVYYRLKDLRIAIEDALSYGDRVLVEERIYGREMTVAILERNGIEVLPIIEIRTPPGSWYDYEHRYTPGLSEHIVPASVPEAHHRRAEDAATKAFQAIGCRDLARVDLVVPENGDLVVLEINTMPGMTPTSLYPDAAKAAGLSFEELVAHLVERAYGRR